MIGLGLSLNEACKAVCEVANGMFDRKWKVAGSNNDIFDKNTLPDKRRIREALDLAEAQALCVVADEIIKTSNEGQMITHAVDSTTKKGIGQFAVQGIHIGKELPFALPLTNICGEKTDDIALQVDLMFEILAAVKKQPVEELYKHVDTDITDSTEHNKGFNKILQEMYGLEKPAGQLFCGTHTTLGFASAMNKVTRTLEQDMKVESVLSGFMVDMQVDSKNSSVAGQALDMCLKLVAPEYLHKTWNYCNLFKNYLERNGVPMILFSYKDQRFGCLSRAASVLLFYYNHLSDFLEKNPQICNRLACLVRDLLNLPYLKVIFVAFASLGVHVVEPFYARTIANCATHTDLKEFYRTLYQSMSEPITTSFFVFEKPAFCGISDQLFLRVKESYGLPVLHAVSSVALDHKEELVMLTNLMLSEMKIVLARQRRDYGVDEEAFPAVYPIEKQASNINGTPVNNCGMESFCGQVDYRAKKLRTLKAVSRSMVIEKAKALRQGCTTSIRYFKDAVKAKKEIELHWAKQMKEKFAKGADEKQIIAQRKEKKRLNMLECLKYQGGPFTNAEQVKEYLEKQDIDEKSKKDRMKKEIQFARESSTTLPKTDPLFKIQITLPSKKRRDKNSQEYGESMMSYLGKKEDYVCLEFEKFRDSLVKYVIT